MKKSICIEKIFLEYDFYARLAKVAEAGFQYVEFGYWPGRDISRIKAECDKHGDVYKRQLRTLPMYYSTDTCPVR